MFHCWRADIRSGFRVHILSDDRESPGRSNAGHPLLPMAYGILETANGHIALVGVLPDKRKAFYDAVGVPELIEMSDSHPLSTRQRYGNRYSSC
ncbi:MAG: hypothetical protein Ct9H90mP5_05590 [Acidimicrobiaceae bacterium]|nr:MAG: hypothetical protein Ct9H90mP5_05590 [Acidimicrobiaceae bacterium]